jgi:HAD superfamily hydrolase (TIGR01458 family)
LEKLILTLKALLIDVDGTLTFKGAMIPGADDALRLARDMGYKLRFLTNITAKLPEQIANELSDLGLDVAPHEVHTATTACVRELKKKDGVRCHFMLPDHIIPLFADIQIDDDSPDFVVISDIGAGFTYEALNNAFLLLRNGAELIALQKNLFWHDIDGLKLDCGAFIVGLEAASGKRATVMGKPTPSFFLQSCADLGCSVDEVIVIGDDVKTDILGAQNIGALNVLVGTGKFERALYSSMERKPDFILPSIAELPRLLSDVTH